MHSTKRGFSGADVGVADGSLACCRLLELVHHSFNRVLQMIARVTISLICLFAATSRSYSQDATPVQLEGATVEISNVRVMMEEMRQGSSANNPRSPKPVVTDKLLRPGTELYVAFDYELRLDVSDELTDVKQIYCGVDITDGFRGYGPSALDQKTGTAMVWLSGVFPDENKRVNIETRLVLYGMKQDETRIPSVTAPGPIRIKCSMDRYAQISETQFDALKAMYRRVLALENRINDLEAKLTP